MRGYPEGLDTPELLLGAIRTIEEILLEHRNASPIFTLFTPQQSLFS